MSRNINTRNYWENRFSSGDWELCQGRIQTADFAMGQLPHLPIERNFNGTILDFGCGLGDAIPIYKDHFPNAKLIGMDISQSAIDKCMIKYGLIGSFFQGTVENIFDVDVIIASNVLEHLDNDKDIVRALLSKCKQLYIIVPYDEMPLCSEHINRYREDYFSEFENYDYKIFKCQGWSYFGFMDLYYHVYFKNILRFFLGRPLVHQRKQIIFRFN